MTGAVLYDAFGAVVSRTGTTATPFGFVGAAQYQSAADSRLPDIAAPIPIAKPRASKSRRWSESQDVP